MIQERKARPGSQKMNKKIFCYQIGPRVGRFIKKASDKTLVTVGRIMLMTSLSLGFTIKSLLNKRNDSIDREEIEKNDTE